MLIIHMIYIMITIYTYVYIVFTSKVLPLIQIWHYVNSKFI